MLIALWRRCMSGISCCVADVRAVDVGPFMPLRCQTSGYLRITFVKLARWQLGPPRRTPPSHKSERCPGRCWRRRTATLAPTLFALLMIKGRPQATTLLAELPLQAKSPSPPNNHPPRPRPRIPHPRSLQPSQSWMPTVSSCCTRTLRSHRHPHKDEARWLVEKQDCRFGECLL